jgi:hypothetical protein
MTSNEALHREETRDAVEAAIGLSGGPGAKLRNTCGLLAENKETRLCFFPLCWWVNQLRKNADSLHDQPRLLAQDAKGEAIGFLTSVFLLSPPARQDDRLESWNHQLPLKRP